MVLATKIRIWYFNILINFATLYFYPSTEVVKAVYRKDKRDNNEDSDEDPKSQTKVCSSHFHN